MYFQWKIQSIIAVCAEIFEDEHFLGAKESIEITNQLNFPPNWNDNVISVKVTPGCSLTLYEHFHNEGLLVCKISFWNEIEVWHI